MHERARRRFRAVWRAWTGCRRRALSPPPLCVGASLGLEPSRGVARARARWGEGEGEGEGEPGRGRAGAGGDEAHTVAVREEEGRGAARRVGTKHTP